MSYNWFCENSCTYPSKKGKKKWRKTPLYSLTSSPLSEAVRGCTLTFYFSKYLLFAGKHASILSTHFFNGGFKLLLQNKSIDCLGFLDYLNICFKVLAAQCTLQWQKQSEITQYEIWVARWMLDHVNVMAFEPLLYKSSHMRLSIISMKNSLSKKFWLFQPDIIKDSFHYHLVLLLTYLCF